MGYDFSEMERLDRTYREEFPDLGPLGVSNHDVRRYRQQARLTTLQRLLRSMGKRFSYLEDMSLDLDEDLINIGEM
jgi:hypothetical protein